MKKTKLLYSVVAYINSNAASKLYVSASVQNSPLTVDEYEALTWVEINGVGNVGERGKKTNILTYPLWDENVIDKAKGMTDAGSPELELARIPGDAGQAILLTAGAVGNNNKYAFKEVRSDGTTATNGTHFYNRGVVGGPARPGGGNEDFDLLVFTLGLVQEEITVDPLAGGVAPVMTAAPAITGTATVGETLSLSNGTFTGDATIVYTYQWYNSGVSISGATSNTFDLTSAQTGKIVSAKVVATNASGTAFGFAAPTSAVAAS